MEGPLSERHTMGGWLCGEGQCRDGDTGMEGTLATLPDTICSFSGIAEGRECRQDRGNRTPFLSLPWEGSFPGVESHGRGPGSGQESPRGWCRPPGSLSGSTAAEGQVSRGGRRKPPGLTVRQLPLAVLFLPGPMSVQ